MGGLAFAANQQADAAHNGGGSNSSNSSGGSNSSGTGALGLPGWVYAIPGVGLMFAAADAAYAVAGSDEPETGSDDGGSDEDDGPVTFWGWVKGLFDGAVSTAKWGFAAYATVAVSGVLGLYFLTRGGVIAAVADSIRKGSSLLLGG